MIILDKFGVDSVFIEYFFAIRFNKKSPLVLKDFGIDHISAFKRCFDEFHTILFYPIVE